MKTILSSEIELYDVAVVPGTFGWDDELIARLRFPVRLFLASLLASFVPLLLSLSVAPSPFFFLFSAMGWGDSNFLSHLFLFLFLICTFTIYFCSTYHL